MGFRRGDHVEGLTSGTCKCLTVAIRRRSPALPGGSPNCGDGRPAKKKGVHGETSFPPWLLEQDEAEDDQSNAG